MRHKTRLCSGSEKQVSCSWGSKGNENRQSLGSRRKNIRLPTKKERRVDHAENLENIYKRGIQLNRRLVLKKQHRQIYTELNK
jgi:hypothetical protein